MGKIKLYIFGILLCLCSIGASSLFLSTLSYTYTTKNDCEVSIIDTKSRLADIIAESNFSTPTPRVENAEPQSSAPTSFRIKTNNEKASILGNHISFFASAQKHIKQSKSTNISIQFDYSSSYYIFALRHIIV
ncbi:MAG: hypothetical protein RSF94_05560 [Rikenellaceae bacterium]